MFIRVKTEKDRIKFYLVKSVRVRGLPRQSTRFLASIRRSVINRLAVLDYMISDLKPYFDISRDYNETEHQKMRQRVALFWNQIDEKLRTLSSTIASDARGEIKRRLAALSPRALRTIAEVQL